MVLCNDILEDGVSLPMLALVYSYSYVTKGDDSLLLQYLVLVVVVPMWATHVIHPYIHTTGHAVLYIL
jgi:hypothetical protein